MKHYTKMSYFYITAVTLTFVMACSPSEKSDYMFTLPDGTWICDEYFSQGIDCEHVMSGRKVKRIYLSDNVTVIEIKEGTK